MCQFSFISVLSISDNSPVFHKMNREGNNKRMENGAGKGSMEERVARSNRRFKKERLPDLGTLLCCFIVLDSSRGGHPQCPPPHTLQNRSSVTAKTIEFTAVPTPAPWTAPGIAGTQHIPLK